MISKTGLVSECDHGNREGEKKEGEEGGFLMFWGGSLVAFQIRFHDREKGD